MEEDRTETPKPRIRVPAPKTRAVLTTARLIWRSSVAAVILVGALYAAYRIDQFLVRDPRFILGGPDGSPENSTIEIRGAAHASRRAIQNAFFADLGRSVYLIPLSDRRQALSSIDWVRQASVARFWPNRVVVRVEERRPVAFLAISSTRFGLIDEDGIILPPAADHFELPVLTGVRPSLALPDRKARVRLLMRLMGELGAGASKISEVDVTDRDNVAVTQPWEGRMVTLLLGDERFGVRYQNFVRNYGEIKRRLPGAKKLDLRLEDRITVVE